MSRKMSYTKRLHNVSDIILEDYFIKSPPQDKLDNPKSWKRRYFAFVQLVQGNEEQIKGKCQKGKTRLNCESFYMMYWNDEAERKKGKKPIRIVPITYQNIIQTVQHPLWKYKYEHVLKLITNDREFYLCAKSDTQKTLWFESIRQVIEEEIKCHDQNEELKKVNNEKEPIYDELDTLQREHSLRRMSINWDFFNLKERRDSGISTSPSYVSTSSSDRRSSIYSNEEIYQNYDSSINLNARNNPDSSSGRSLDSTWPSNDKEETIYTKMHSCNTMLNSTWPSTSNEEVIYTKMDSCTTDGSNMPLHFNNRSYSLAEGKDSGGVPHIASVRSTSENYPKKIPATSNSIFDFAVTDNGNKKRITFCDIVLEVPNESVVQINADEMSITTSSFEWKLTKKNF